MPSFRTTLAIASTSNRTEEWTYILQAISAVHLYGWSTTDNMWLSCIPHNCFCNKDNTAVRALLLMLDTTLVGSRRTMTTKQNRVGKPRL